MNRRDFLKAVVKSFFLLLGLSLFLPVLYIYPYRIKKKTVELFPVLDEDELPRSGVKRINLSYERGGRKINTRAFIVMSRTGLTALSPVCSHLGCLVNWDSNKREFLCPCHGGRYNMDGDVIAGPPQRPLTRLPIVIREGKVYIGMRI